MENEKYMEQLIEIEDSDGENQSDPYTTAKNDQYKTAKRDNVDSNSPSLSGKSENIECEKASLEKECNSANSWKEQGFSSGITQDSLQGPSKKYYESQLSNDDEYLSNATDSQDIKDDHSEPFIETMIDEKDENKLSDKSSKVKSVIKLSPSMHSNMKESIVSDNETPETRQSDEQKSTPIEHILPDRKGFFTFPEDRKTHEESEGKFSGKHTKQSYITKAQLISRVKNNKVLVVSVFGRSSRIDSSGDKAFIFDDLMKKDVFRFRLLEESDSDTSYDSSSDNEQIVPDETSHRSNKEHPLIVSLIHLNFQYLPERLCIVHFQ